MTSSEFASSFIVHLPMVGWKVNERWALQVIDIWSIVHLEKFEVWLVSSAFEWSNLCDAELYHWFTGSMAWLCMESEVFSSVITQYCCDGLPYYILAWQSIHANWKPLCYWMVPSFSLLIISGKLRAGRGESLMLPLHGSRRQRQNGMREFLSERCWETVEGLWEQFMLKPKLVQQIYVLHEPRCNTR